MMLFLVSFAVILLMIVLMAVGVWWGKREPLKGTCGGLNRFTGDKECPVCGGDANNCETAGWGSGSRGVRRSGPWK